MTLSVCSLDGCSCFLGADEDDAMRVNTAIVCFLPIIQSKVDEQEENREKSKKSSTRNASQLQLFLSAFHNEYRPTPSKRMVPYVSQRNFRLSNVAKAYHIKIVIGTVFLHSLCRRRQIPVTNRGIAAAFGCLIVRKSAFFLLRNATAAVR